MKEQGQNLIKQVKIDIENYRKGIIERMPTNKEYSKIFEISYDTVSSYLKKGLSQEDKDYRKKAIQKQEGGKSWNNKSQEEKQKQREIASDNLKNSFLSEEMHKASLESKGWVVERLFKKEEIEGLGWRNIFRYTELQDFLKGTKQEKVAEKLLSKLEELRKRECKLQDFICKKKGYVKFCEVKNKKICNPNEIKQMTAIKEIWDNFGIETELVNIYLSLKDIAKFAEEKGRNTVTIQADENRDIYFS